MILKADMVGEIPYKKFMFDTDFDELAERREKARAKAAAEAARREAAEPEPEPEPEAPTFSEEDLARAREEGFAEGKRQGVDEAAATVEKQIADTLAAVAGQMQTLFDAQAEAHQNVTHHAVSVAAALVRKLFPTLNEQTALDQVRSMLEAALGQLTGEAEVVVRVPESLAEDLHERIDAVSQLSGFRGNVKVLGDPALAVGDCRLEWSSGGVKRSAGELARQLDEIVARNLDHSRFGPDAPDQEPAAEMPAAEAGTPDAVDAAPEPVAVAEAPATEEAQAQPAPAEAAAPETAPELAGEERTGGDAPESGPAPEAESGPEPEQAPEPERALTAEDVAAGPPPVPSEEIMAEAEVDAALHAPAADDGDHAPIPSADLTEEVTAEAAPEEAEEPEETAPETRHYGGADLELEDDLKD